MNYHIFSLIIGFTIWLLATISFRIAGQYFFLTDNSIVMFGLYLSVIQVLGAVATWIFNKYKLGIYSSFRDYGYARYDFRHILYSIFHFGISQPARKKNGASFGSWLLWAYATVLVFGLIRKKNK